MRLAGENALVTGSTAGIGRAIAIEFARQGANVVVTGRDVERGAAVVATIEAAGGRAAFCAADLADEAACADLVAHAIAALGGVSVLVNNAAGGGHADARVGDLATDAWEAILRVDLSAPFWLCRAALPHMERNGRGAIVNISSRQAERASPGFAAYIAAKGGLNALDAVDRRRLRGRRHPLQHDQPRLRPQRPTRCGYRRDATRALRGHAPHAPRRGR